MQKRQNQAPEADDSPDAYLQQTIRNSVMLERLKAETVRKFAEVLRSADRLVRDQLTRKELSTYSRDRLDVFVSQLSEKLVEIYVAYGAVIQADALEIALHQGAFEAQSLAEAFPSLTFTPPTATALRAALATAPLQVTGIDGGLLLKAFVKGWPKAEAQRATSVILIGYSQGQTNSQMVQAIRGTAEQNYSDGVLAVTERNARSVVQTAVQHAATTARMATFRANPDVVLGYRWVSTLDRKTSLLCKGLDGRVFEVGKGPLPPAHINCRSTTIAVTELSDMFAKDATRASVGADGAAQVPAGQNYYDWLATQPASFQDLALGPVRAKLFRDGGLSPQRWAQLALDRNFKPLTLDQLRKEAPTMFTRAGIK